MAYVDQHYNERRSSSDHAKAQRIAWSTGSRSLILRAQLSPEPRPRHDSRRSASVALPQRAPLSPETSRHEFQHSASVAHTDRAALSPEHHSYHDRVPLSPKPRRHASLHKPSLILPSRAPLSPESRSRHEFSHSASVALPDRAPLSPEHDSFHEVHLRSSLDPPDGAPASSDPHSHHSRAPLSPKPRRHGSYHKASLELHDKTQESHSGHKSHHSTCLEPPDRMSASSDPHSQYKRAPLSPKPRRHGSYHKGSSTNHDKTPLSPEPRPCQEFHHGISLEPPDRAPAISESHSHHSRAPLSPKPRRHGSYHKTSLELQDKAPSSPDPHSYHEFQHSTSLEHPDRKSAVSDSHSYHNRAPSSPKPRRHGSYHKASLEAPPSPERRASHEFQHSVSLEPPDRISTSFDSHSHHNRAPLSPKPRRHGSYHKASLEAPSSPERRASHEFQHSVSLEPPDRISISFDSHSHHNRTPLSPKPRRHESYHKASLEAPPSPERRASHEFQHSVSLEPPDKISTSFDSHSHHNRAPLSPKPRRHGSHHKETFEFHDNVPLSAEPRSCHELQHRSSLEPPDITSASSESQSHHGRAPLSPKPRRHGSYHKASLEFPEKTPSSERRASNEFQHSVSLEPPDRTSGSSDPHFHNNRAPLSPKPRRHGSYHKETFEFHDKAQLSGESHSCHELQHRSSLEPPDTYESQSHHGRAPLSPKPRRHGSYHKETLELNDRAPLSSERRASNEFQHSSSLEPPDRTSVSSDPHFHHNKAPLSPKPRRHGSYHKETLEFSDKAPLSTEPHSCHDLQHRSALEPPDRESANPESRSHHNRAPLSPKPRRHGSYHKATLTRSDRAPSPEPLDKVPSNCEPRSGYDFDHNTSLSRGSASSGSHSFRKRTPLSPKLHRQGRYHKAPLTRSDRAPSPEPHSRQASPEPSDAISLSPEPPSQQEFHYSTAVGLPDRAQLSPEPSTHHGFQYSTSLTLPDRTLLSPEAHSRQEFHYNKSLTLPDRPLLSSEHHNQHENRRSTSLACSNTTQLSPEFPRRHESRRSASLAPDHGRSPIRRTCSIRSHSTGDRAR